VNNQVFLLLILAILVTAGIACLYYITSAAAVPTISVADRFISDASTPAVPTLNQQDKTVSTSSTDESFSIVFVGDMMFDRHIRLNAQKRGGYDEVIGPKLSTLLDTADVVVGNLEGPVTTFPSRSINSAIGSTNNYLFTFDPAVIQLLVKHNILVVNLGNNHILNFGKDGLQQTREYLRRAGITYFGATGDIASPSGRWSERVIKGTKVAFINYNQFTPEGEAQTLADLNSASHSADLHVVYTHWGNEYVPENEVLKKQARQFVSAGADLIIGSHPHVITGVEDIGNTRVYYSLGNFIFDQYFEPAVQTGLVVKATYDPSLRAFAFEEYQVSMKKDGTTELNTQILQN
jgi:poly-gamma-glutamate synthesis protein (capsule biosynthesis protein)